VRPGTHKPVVLPARPARAAWLVARLLPLLLAAVLGGGVLIVAAGPQAPPANATKSLDELQKLIEQAQKKKGSLAKVIDRLDKRLNAIEAKLSTLQEKITVVSGKLDEQQVVYDRLFVELQAKQRELKKAELELAWQQSVFDDRVVEAYKLGDVDYLDLLMASQGFEDFVTRLGFVKRLVDSDDNLVGDLTDARNTVKTQKHEVLVDTVAARKIRDELKKRNDELVALRKEQQAAAALAKADRSAKNQVLAKVETDIRAWTAQEAQLAAESQGLAGVINGLAGNGDGKSTGSMVWPTSGSLSSPFGWRIHPIFHVRKFHTGIDIGAGYGVPIHAADGGRVIYATWMSGYGNTTIIDHGGGISTLYAHQSQILITSGTVTKGQVVGYVGSTGYSTGPHLHFEVRVNGNPVDPLGYL
jgi:murein DD-endopeptidase MepM/ murein hydrolase activator NlpD